MQAAQADEAAITNQAETGIKTGSIIASLRCCRDGLQSGSKFAQAEKSRKASLEFARKITSPG